MKIFKKIVLFILIGTLFATCKKETLTPSTTVGQPVFSFSGNIGGLSRNWQAGVNNYYMYSSYAQNPAGINLIVYSFTGTLQNTGTPNNSISVTLNDDTIVSPGTLSNISKSITASSYYYNVPDGNPIWDSVTFSPHVYAGNPTKYTYNFGDGNTQIILNTSPVIHVYKILKNYNTSLTVNSITGNPTITNPLNLKKQTSTPLTIESMSATDSSPPNNHTVSFSAYVSGGAPPYTYIWFFGNGRTSASVSTSNSVTTSYTYTGAVQTYTDSLLVIDQLYDTAMHTYTLIDTTVSSTCRVDYFTTITPIRNPNSLSNVTVNYTDPYGNAYTSNNESQPNTSTFQITSVSPYQNNLSNNPTKMLKVAFSCMLYPVNSGSSLTPIQASNCTATIAVAYH